MITKKCLQCGKKFEVRLSGENRKYCSQKCYADASKGMNNHKSDCKCSFCKALRKEYLGSRNPKFSGCFSIVCKYCEKEFTVIKARKDIAKYCSYECYRKDNGHRVKAELKECIICGKLTKNKKYCSKKCTGVGRIGDTNIMSNGGFLQFHKKDCSCSFCKSMRGEQKGINSPSYKVGKINKICVNCGKEFKVYPSLNRIYCSVPCAREHYRGEIFWNWKGGISKLPYPFDFNESLKEKIRNRDNRTCQICGKIEEENSRKLDVHHIDFNKENLELDNLISLCLSCHMRTNYNREYWIEYFKEKVTK